MTRTLPTAASEAAERTERHMRVLAELVDGAAQLARDAMQVALRRSAAAAATDAAGLPPPSVPRPEGPGPYDDFCRLFDRVCRGIALEGKLAGRKAGADRDLKRERRIAPRRTRVRDILHDTVVVDPEGRDEATLLQAIEQALHDPDVEELMAEGALIGDVLVTICRGFDLLLDHDRIPDDALRTTRAYPFVYRSSTMAEAVGCHSLRRQGPDPP